MTDFPLRTNLSGLCWASAVLATLTPCRGADPTLAPEVKEPLAAVRNTQASVFDVFESSKLGKTATPAKFSATAQPAKTLIQP